MLSEMTSPGEIYVIRVDDMMNGVPYADAFYTEHNWCLSMVRKMVPFLECCQMAKLDSPPSSLAQSKERKGSNFAA